MQKLLVGLIAALALPASAAAHTSKGTLVCPDVNAAAPALQASITGDSFPAGHHVSVTLKVVDNGVTLTNAQVVADSPNGNLTFGPFTVQRQGPADSVAHASATFTIHDKAENADYVGLGSFTGKCGGVPPPLPPIVPPAPPVPPVVPPAPPVVPPAPPVPPVVPPAPKCEHRANGVIVCKRPPHKCKHGFRLPRRDKHGHRYTVCYVPPKRPPHFTG